MNRSNGSCGPFVRPCPCRRLPRAAFSRHRQTEQQIQPRIMVTQGHHRLASPSRRRQGQLSQSIFSARTMQMHPCQRWAMSSSLNLKSWICSLCKTQPLARGLLNNKSSFWQHMHGHIPILDTSRATPDICDSTPFMFWTIIVVTCRYHPKHYALFHLLHPHYRPLLGKALASSPASLYTIQTLLILCYWPLPCQKQPHDPSWHICGVAINAALSLGLHTSNNRRALKLTQEHREARTKTWLACLYISTLYALT